jgi:hypothetical protein
MRANEYIGLTSMKKTMTMKDQRNRCMAHVSEECANCMEQESFGQDHAHHDILHACGLKQDVVFATCRNGCKQSRAFR